MKNILISTGHELKYPDIIRAENCTLHDSSGNIYLDLESGVWCTSIGHSNPRITEIIKEQSGKIMHTGYCYLNPAVEKAAVRLLGITGINEGRCVFLNSGSEAVEFSVKAVNSFSDRPYFLTMKDSYLSAYGISGQRNPEEWIAFDWINNDRIEDIPFDKIAAFVFEPGSSSGLVRFPPLDLIRSIADKVRSAGGLIIGNEITTGMARTGEWFGYNHYGFIPDIAAIGKGLGNGYPVSCAVISEKVLRRLDLNVFHYGQSHQNDPLGAAVACEVIDVIEENNLLLKCRQDGDLIRSALNKMKEKYGIISEVRGKGLMIAVEFENNTSFSYAEKINRELLKNNIILVKRPGYEIFRIDPALTIERKDIDYFLSAMERIISNMKILLPD
ncbi:MAG: aspartate aminotransferase family protein [Spirochaetes bacterium]|nr:aspartate aminotransferase family protein [Spirochaetota bacterium]